MPREMEYMYHLVCERRIWLYLRDHRLCLTDRLSTLRGTCRSAQIRLGAMPEIAAPSAVVNRLENVQRPVTVGLLGVPHIVSSPSTICAFTISRGMNTLARCSTHAVRC